MGHEPLTKFVVLFVVSLQVYMALHLRHTHPLSPWFLFCAYAVGGTANHNLFLAIHEITHNLAFKGIRPNKLLAIFANLPIGIPYSAAFKVSSIPSRLHIGHRCLCSGLCVFPNFHFMANDIEIIPMSVKVRHLLRDVADPVKIVSWMSKIQLRTFWHSSSRHGCNLIVSVEFAGGLKLSMKRSVAIQTLHMFEHR
jgi:hypothetical protein